MRLIRQLLTESMMLAFGGAVIGFALAWVAARSLSRFELPIAFPISLDFSPDWRVMLYTIAIAIVTGVLFGLAPALRSARTDLVTCLKDDGTGMAGTRRFGLRNILVVVQVSLSLVLLISAGLFVRSLQNASTIDLGMKTGNVVMMAFDPKLNGYSPKRTKQFLLQLRESAVRRSPECSPCRFWISIPLSIGGVSFEFERSTPEGGKKSANSDVYRVGRGYFATLGIPMLRGRDFELQDGDGAAILNEKFAAELFPNGDAVRGTSYGRQAHVPGDCGGQERQITDPRRRSTPLRLPVLGR